MVWFVIGPASCNFCSMEPDTLARRLAATRAQIDRDNPDFGPAYDRLIAKLNARGAGNVALRSGDLLPEFALPNAEGQLCTSSELLSRGAIVLAFYRGGWCPFCRDQFAALAESIDAIAEAGGHVVMISGETGGRGRALKRRFGARFEVLSDADFGLALRFGLVFQLPAEIIALLHRIGKYIEEYYGNSSGFLPIPATYVVAPDGRIVAHHVDVDFRKRMEPAAILAALAGIQAGA